MLVRGYINLSFKKVIVALKETHFFLWLSWNLNFLLFNFFVFGSKLKFQSVQNKVEVHHLLSSPFSSVFYLLSKIDIISYIIFDFCLIIMFIQFVLLMSVIFWNYKFKRFVNCFAERPKTWAFNLMLVVVDPGGIEVKKVLMKAKKEGKFVLMLQ